MRTYAYSDTTCTHWIHANYEQNVRQAQVQRRVAAIRHCRTASAILCGTLLGAGGVEDIFPVGAASAL